MRSRSRDQENELKTHPKTHQNIWRNMNVQEFWVFGPCKSGYFSFTNMLPCYIGNSWVDFTINSGFGCDLCSMNAPVMVELEGETDPLEVSYLAYLWALVNYSICFALRLSLLLMIWYFWDLTSIYNGPSSIVSHQKGFYGVVSRKHVIGCIQQLCPDYDRLSYYVRCCS